MWDVGSSNHFNSFPLSDTSEEPAASAALTCLSLGDLHNLHILLLLSELDGSWKVFFQLNRGPAIRCTATKAAIKVRGRRLSSPPSAYAGSLRSFLCFSHSAFSDFSCHVGSAEPCASSATGALPKCSSIPITKRHSEGCLCAAPLNTNKVSFLKK